MEDAKAIVSHTFLALKDKINPKDIFILGRSLGGAVATYVINQLKPNIRGLIVENTFTSMSDLVDRIFPFLKQVKNLLLKNHWPTKDRIKNLNVPILFFMSAKDELIPIEHMQNLYAKAENAKFKSKFVIKDGTHNESWIKAGRTYFVEFAKFLKKCGANLSKQSIYLDSDLDDDQEAKDDYSEQEESNNQTGFDLEKAPLNYGHSNYNSINENEFIEIDETPLVKEFKNKRENLDYDNDNHKYDGK